MNAANELIIWIVPRAEDQARFGQVIEQLAVPRGAATFVPHITLGAVRGDLPDIRPVLETLAGLELSPSAFGETDAFTMSLFVRFDISAPLLEARRLLEAVPGFRRGRPFDPHISLMYGSPEERDARKANLDILLNEPVVFDRLVVMQIPLPVATQEDIRKWREIDCFEIPSAA